jgi:enoyl-CoA hydratase
MSALVAWHSMVDAVKYEVQDDVAVITVDDGKANALSFEVIDGLGAAMTQAGDEAKAMAIIGREGKFSAGFDLAVMSGGVDDARRLLGSGASMGLEMFTAPIPVVLGVTGHALAMGAILTTCADYRVGASGPYKIGLNEVGNGMPVPGFGVGLCQQRLSKRWFDRCVQLAYICSPDEALDAGFVDELTELDNVAGRAVEVAGQLAGYVHAAPFRQTRINVREDLAAALREGLDADMKLFDVTS